MEEILVGFFGLGMVFLLVSIMVYPMLRVIMESPQLFRSGSCTHTLILDGDRGFGRPVVTFRVSRELSYEENIHFEDWHRLETYRHRNEGTALPSQFTWNGIEFRVIDFFHEGTMDH